MKDTKPLLCQCTVMLVTTSLALLEIKAHRTPSSHGDDPILYLFEATLLISCYTTFPFTCYFITMLKI